MMFTDFFTFTGDRMPTHLGWTKSPVNLTKDDIFSMSSVVAAAATATNAPLPNVL